jgi:uncharacterized protein YchJ
MNSYSEVLSNVASDIGMVERAMRRSGLSFSKGYQGNMYKATPKQQGRNEPCNCGSGKKFKKCCGQ